uniref:AAA+ ATPase domain-containing protein n=1 Tax=Globisporangium ultimum (strain ATCC 200006 / CBS 805.95 / DAOM BR144) TaxID=431595 RepID=K3WV81_GLOUD
MEDKVILNDVSGAARPGELLMITGPSGAGKSTFLDCISGQNSAVEGSITVNGAGGARLEQVPQHLGRRAQAVVICDGDPHKPVAAPSSELYTLFDTLCLLSEGATVCRGKAAHAVDYFARLGYQCPGFVSPSDYFMRQLEVLGKDKDEEGAKRVQMLKDEWVKHQEQQGSRDVFFEADDATAQPLDHKNYQDGRLETLGQVAVISSYNVNINELPLQIFLPFVLFVPAYFLIGIGHGAATYISLQLLVVLVNFAAIRLEYMVSYDAPKYCIWTQYISPINIPCDVDAESCVARMGDQVLDVYSMNGASTMTDGFILLALDLVLRLIGFVALWANVKGKK